MLLVNLTKIRTDLSALARKYNLYMHTSVSCSSSDVNWEMQLVERYADELKPATLSSLMIALSKMIVSYGWEGVVRAKDIFECTGQVLSFSVNILELAPCVVKWEGEYYPISLRYYPNGSTQDINSSYCYAHVNVVVSEIAKKFKRVILYLDMIPEKRGRSIFVKGFDDVPLIQVTVNFDKKMDDSMILSFIDAWKKDKSESKTYDSGVVDNMFIEKVLKGIGVKRVVGFMQYIPFINGEFPDNIDEYWKNEEYPKIKDNIVLL